MGLKSGEAIERNVWEQISLMEITNILYQNVNEKIPQY
jgi:hypothetical protein